VHCPKILAEFQCGVVALCVRTPKYVALGYDIVKISTGCLVFMGVLSGMTRDNMDGRRVVELEYEAYRPMAQQEMTKICDEIRRRWEVINIYITHRLGSVSLGKFSDSLNALLEMFAVFYNCEEFYDVWIVSI